MIDTSLFVLFIAGLLGGGHCIGMCGGIVAALSLQSPAAGKRWMMLLGYNLGRICSYILIGALMGALGSILLNRTHTLQLVLYLLANLMIMAIGLYLAGLSRAVSLIEQLGKPVWRRLQPWVKKLLPVQTLAQATLAGALWGWVPCGLVYSASLSAMASGSAMTGALSMASFALGTLPNLLAMGMFAAQLRRALQNASIRLSAGLLVTATGCWQLLAVARQIFS
jgi:sulfite exporter TauE/SafE